MIQAIFFDIDGTLVSHTISDIPNGVLDAFLSMQKKGIRLFIATGRHISEFKDLPLHDYPFDGYVTQTGQICYDSKFRSIYEVPLPEEDTKHLTECFAKNELPMVLLNSKNLYINFVNDTVIDTQQSIHTSVPDIGQYGGEALFGATVFGDEAQMKHLARQLPGCKVSRWNPYAADIVLKEAGKVNGIRQMLAQYGISPTRTMAFGDADNDMDMIRFAAIGVAMGNATEQLKNVSDYVTATVDDDGILKALSHYQLI